MTEEFSVRIHEEFIKDRCGDNDGTVLIVAEEESKIPENRGLSAVICFALSSKPASRDIDEVDLTRCHSRYHPRACK